jgi:hypothetical protein
MSTFVCPNRHCGLSFSTKEHMFAHYKSTCYKIYTRLLGPPHPACIKLSGVAGGTASDGNPLPCQPAVSADSSQRVNVKFGSSKVLLLARTKLHSPSIHSKKVKILGPQLLSQHSKLPVLKSRRMIQIKSWIQI